ncbi:LPS translocon maturation chaperone LptM [Caldimonas sp. KR1-144]|uniref:LPS translocon maturation chaperone LptM n=1 Tax=Caldimonas sp. KR1-144 TaxID=3400911 RepID=UPI003C2D4BB7
MISTASSIPVARIAARTVMALAALGALAGCGQKGPLRLPTTSPASPAASAPDGPAASTPTK